MATVAGGLPEFDLSAEGRLTDLIEPPPDLGVVSAPAAGHHRRWLDTFDQRLRSRGAQLYLEDPGRRRARLVLQTGDETTSFPSGGLGTGPVSPHRLPEDLAARIGHWIRPRTLLPLAEADITEITHSLVNGDGKTVCRLLEEQVEPAAGPGVRRLTVAPLRGYEPVPEAATAALLANPDVEPAEGTLLDALLAALGRATAPGSLPYGRGLDRAMAASAGTAVALRRLLDIVAVNLEGTLGQYDIEFLHDLRVAVRRARTVTKLARPVLPEDVSEFLARELRWLGEVTTPGRDLDVQVAGFPEMMGELDATTRADLAPLVELVKAHARRAHSTLNRALRSERFSSLMARATTALDELGRDGHGERLGSFADRQLHKRFRAVERRGQCIEATSPEEALHDLRKRAKELRYTLELFEAVLPGDTLGFVKDLKGLQDVLGSFNDSVVQREFLRRGAHELAGGGAGTDTLLAVGQLIAHTRDAGVQARRSYPAAFAKLDRWRTHLLGGDAGTRSAGPP